MLLSPVNFFVLQTLLFLIIAFSILAIVRSLKKSQTKNYLWLFIKTFVLSLLSVLLLFIVYIAFNPKLTLSLMQDYWRLEMVEDQIDYQQHHTHKPNQQHEHQVADR